MISRLLPQFLSWEPPAKLLPSIIASILMSLHQTAAYQGPAAALLPLGSLHHPLPLEATLLLSASLILPRVPYEQKYAVSTF